MGGDVLFNRDEGAQQHWGVWEESPARLWCLCALLAELARRRCPPQHSDLLTPLDFPALSLSLSELASRAQLSRRCNFSTACCEVARSSSLEAQVTSLECGVAFAGLEVDALEPPHSPLLCEALNTCWQKVVRRPRPSAPHRSPLAELSETAPQLHSSRSSSLRTIPTARRVASDANTLFSLGDASWVLRPEARGRPHRRPYRMRVLEPVACNILQLPLKKYISQLWRCDQGSPPPPARQQRGQQDTSYRRNSSCNRQSNCASKHVSFTERTPSKRASP